MCVLYGDAEMYVLYEDVEDACVLYGIPIGIHLATTNYWQATDLYVREVGKTEPFVTPCGLSQVTEFAFF